MVNGAWCFGTRSAVVRNDGAATDASPKSEFLDFRINWMVESLTKQRKGFVNLAKPLAQARSQTLIISQSDYYINTTSI